MQKNPHRAGGVTANGETTLSRGDFFYLRARPRSRPETQKRQQKDHAALAQLERYLAALTAYRKRLEGGFDDPSKPLQTPVTPAKSLARFLPDGKGTKPDPCKGARDVWGRAGKGVI